MLYYARDLRDRKLREIREHTDSLEIKPSLAVIVVGDNYASSVYVRNKCKMAEKAGINAFTIELDKDCSQKELNNTIDCCSEDYSIDAILLQLPLPRHLDQHDAISHINPLKDADGLTVHNQGRLYQGLECVEPCTPKGIISILEDMYIDLSGKNTTVIGRSMLVGQPVAKMLQDRGATVTICHSKTKNIEEYTSHSNIIISAIGKPELIDSSHISDDTIVVDVGINRLSNGKLVGDVNVEDIGRTREGVIVTAVPGGVGLMTVASLMENVCCCYRVRRGI